MLALALALALVAPPAVAHPMGSRFATQTTHLVVHPEHAELTYVAEVPDAFVDTAAAREGRSPVDAMRAELAAGLVLLVDGEITPMERVDPWPDPVRTSDHTTALTLHFRAPLPPGPHTLEAQTANLQEARNYFAGLVDTAGGVRIAENSLWAHDADGAMVRNDRGRWKRDGRTLTVTTAPPVPGWSLVHPPSPTPVSSWQARIRTARDAVPSGAPTPGLWLLGVGAALLAGTAAGRTAAKGPIALPWAGVLLALAPAVVIDGVSAIVLLLGAVASVLTRRRRDDVDALQPWAWGAVGAGVVASMHAPRAAACVALAWTVGMLLRGRSMPAAIGLVAVGLALGARALLAAPSWVLTPG